MNDFNIRRRLASDDMSTDDVEAALEDLAGQRNDDARDRAAEDHYKEQP